MEKLWEDTIERAIKEDIGSGDHSSNCSIPSDARGKMKLLVKQRGILAGVKVAKAVFAKVDPAVTFHNCLADGILVEPGQIAFELEGPQRSLLQGERLALNFMQRMSGIASYTHRLTEMIKHTSTRLLDTRKTTPSLRFMEKEAVRIGGGVNHRFGLYDMIMLKDNHIDFAGGIKPAVEKAKAYLKAHQLSIPIEVETRNLKELKEVLELDGVLRVMLDNYSPAEVKEAVKMVKGKIETEASGGITEHNLVNYAEAGVDYISIGALTHSVKSLDLSLKAMT